MAETFLGALIHRFDCSVGWGTGVSALNVRLVEDPKNGYFFSAPLEGSPVYFDYKGWKFGGILQSYKYSESIQGKFYDCVINDPREILAGCQMILNNYSGGTFNVPNLFNPYGYLESNGFGEAQTNEGGIPYKNIVVAMNGILQSTPIKYKGYNYSVDLTALPNLPSFYRIPGDSISILDFVTDVCAAGLHDYFFTLTGNNVIQLKTINRSSPPQRGRISAFVNSVNGASVKEAGYENRNETTSKFVVGGDVSIVYIQEYNNQQNDNATIWPYWGLDKDGKLIFGQGDFSSDDDSTHNDFRFDLDSRLIDIPGVGNKYPTDIGELRAALVDEHSWSAYLWAKDKVAGSPQFGRASNLGIMGNLKDVNNFILNDMNKPINDVNINQLLGFNFQFRKNNEKEISRGKQLFDLVSTFAQEYYGRKFMVRIPFVAGKVEAETGRVFLSQTPEQSGFVPEDDWPQAIQNNLLPLDVNRLTTVEGKIEAYVRFDDAKRDANGNIIIANGQMQRRYDFTALSSDDYVVSADGRYVFVKCEVDPNIIFKNRALLSQPRVVITLPAPVYYNRDGEIFDEALLGEIIEKAIINQNQFNKAKLKSFFKKFGADIIDMHSNPHAVLPEFAAVPLKSNVDSYGPWYAVGAEGPVEYEKDESLVPWNYAGFEVMNQTGQAKVSDALSNMQYAETGIITVPGAPSRQLGDELISRGPYVTDVSVTVDTSAITTTYNMVTWTRRFGKLAKAYAERNARIARTFQQQRRFLRELAKVKELQRQKVKQKKVAEIAKRRQKSSSHNIVAANTFDDYKGCSVHFGDVELFSDKINTDFDKKYIGDLSVLFRPFTTDPNGSGARYVEPESGATEPTVNDLDPFGQNHDFPILIRNYDETAEIQDEYNEDGTDIYRTIGLKAPLILVGWGRDINGDIVPDVSNYRERQDLWKAGPLDARWNESRGVWEAGGGTTLVEVAFENTLCGNQSEDYTPVSGYLRTSASGDISSQYGSNFFGTELVRIENRTNVCFFGNGSFSNYSTHICYHDKFIDSYVPVMNKTTIVRGTIYSTLPLQLLPLSCSGTIPITDWLDTSCLQPGRKAIAMYDNCNNEWYIVNSDCPSIT